MTLNRILIILFGALVFSCRQVEQHKEQTANPLEGTWQLISGTLIEKGDTTVTDYTKNISMIKVINKTHFAFLNHDLNMGQDSTATFVAGGGPYNLNGDQYTEFLIYCSDRQWEGNEFHFTIKVENDTLTQTGVEKVESAGVDRINMEKYVKVSEP
ncbi:MAG TPA: hypothetical protein VFW11_12480 [Cyclobacteriaceae bacterium]|nr:hypothetical protein [Cyclobacteriaceae bacterium]